MAQRNNLIQKQMKLKTNLPKKVIVLEHYSHIDIRLHANN